MPSSITEGLLLFLMSVMACAVSGPAKAEMGREDVHDRAANLDGRSDCAARLAALRYNASLCNFMS